ncbi:MAG: aminotransferase class V-fold PLP-dependent enzyme [Geminicoccaceae bacterium]
MVERGRHFLMLPGPTPVPERVQRAMLVSGIDFASPEFVASARSCHRDLARLFGTAGEVIAYIANGHGAWEVPLVNLFEPGDTILVTGTGRFSRSWSEMAEHLGLVAVETATDWRRAFDPDLIAERLAADREHRIKAVLAVHTETATACTGDLPALRRAMDSTGHPALLAVDAIASLGVEPFAMDEWGMDVALSASQKGLMLPAGLAFVALNGKAMAVAERCRHPRRYWDIQFRRGDESYMWFHGTPPVQAMFGLRAALDMLFEEGLDTVVARHRRLADGVRRAVAAWSEAGAMEINALQPEQRSNAVTAIRTEEGLDPVRLRQVTRERFALSIGGGLGDLQGRAFRIGHLGDLNEPMVLGALGAIEAAFRVCDFPFRSGLDAAAAYFAEASPSTGTT